MRWPRSQQGRCFKAAVEETRPPRPLAACQPFGFAAASRWVDFSVLGESIPEITSIRERRNRARVSVDGEFWAEVDAAVAIESGLREGAEFSQEELDRDPWLVNCQNGTLDLRTGRLKDHDPSNLITKIIPVDYDPVHECYYQPVDLEDPWVLVRDGLDPPAAADSPLNGCFRR